VSKDKLPISVSDIDGAPSSIPAIVPVDYQQKFFEIQKRLSEISEEKFSLQEENSRLRAENGTRKLLDDLIKPLSSKIFYFMCVYAAFVGAVVLRSASHAEFKIPETILALLVGSTAATVLGLVGMILTGVFLSSKPK
jgi:hypothetical protein